VTTDADPEVAWLLDRERGLPATAPSPALERAHERLAAALAGLPALPALPSAAADTAWQDQVLARIDAQAVAAPVPLRPRRAARWVALAAPALAAAAAVVLWLGRDRAAPADAEPAALSVVVTPGAAARRGDAPATVGDVLAAVARPGAELRIYRGDHVLLVRCPGQAACRVAADGAPAVDWPLAAPGRYRAFAVAGTAPAPTGDLDADLAAAARAGAQVTAAPAIDVE
jgi:hypothetical protein